MECPVCYDDVSAADGVTTPCKHTFHRACINSWISTKGTGKAPCPMCRSPLKMAALKRKCTGMTLRHGPCLMNASLKSADKCRYHGTADELRGEIAYLERTLAAM